ncbi:MAG: M20/M25/M40 family metallo-hydrolase [Chryseolinea sp.]
MKFVAAVLVFLTLACPLVSAQVDSVRILNHIKILSDDANQGRAAGSVGEASAADYVRSAFTQLQLQPRGDANTYLQSFQFKKGIHGEGESGTAHNIIGYLDNDAKYTVIIGAHYDHLGTDGQGSSLDPNPSNKIHNGADDNASGVAGVLELARYFSTNSVKEKCNFLFSCFSGEELGLLGSKYFADHSPVKISSINYMINMDMIGRMDRQSHILLVSGTGTSPVWEPLLKKIRGVTIKTDSSGTGPSDHTSFYLKGIPAIHFFTGSHSDYHKPSDDWEKINATGEAEVLKVIIDVVESLDSKGKLTFLKTKTKSLAGRSSFKVTLGIMPSYSGDVDGLKVDGVSDNKPAQKAGIISGDIILKIGEMEIHDIQNYMDALNKFEKGQTVPVKIKRAESVVTLSVTF